MRNRSFMVARAAILFTFHAGQLGDLRDVMRLCKKYVSGYKPAPEDRRRASISPCSKAVDETTLCVRGAGLNFESCRMVRAFLWK